MLLDADISCNEDVVNALLSQMLTVLRSQVHAMP